MCVYSMIVDWGKDELEKYVPPVPPAIPTWPPVPNSTEDRLQKLEQAVGQINDLLKRAKIYDEENHEPDCELEAKKDALAAMAEKLGVVIEFPE